jgi:MFS family permease
MDRQELSAVLAIALLYVIRMLGLFMVLPVLPLLGPEYDGGTPMAIGLALGVYGLSQALLQIPLGFLSDRFGRKPVIYSGLAVFIAGSLVAAFATTIELVIVGRLLQGCGAISSSLLALVADVTRTQNRTKAMAIVGISIGSSFGISLIIGPLISAQFGLSGIFVATAMAGVLGIIVLAKVVPTPSVIIKRANSRFDLSKIRSVFVDANLMKTTLGVFMLHYLLMAGFLVFPKVLTQAGFVEQDHYQVYFWLLIVTFLLMGPFMWLAEKPGFGKYLMLSMIGVFAISLGMLANVSTMVLVVIAMGLFFMAFNLLEVMLPAFVSRIVHAGERGTAMGIYSSAQFFGAFMGGLVGGSVLQWWDMSTLVYVNIACCALWLISSLKLNGFEKFASVTYVIDTEDMRPDKEVKEALLLLSGVIEVALLDSERVAYLKVDSALWNEDSLGRV